MSFLSTLLARLTPPASVVAPLRLPVYVFVRAVPCLLLVPTVRSAVAPAGEVPSHVRVKIFHDARLTRASLRVERGALLVRSPTDASAAPLRIEAGTTFRLVVSGTEACLENDDARRCASTLQMAPTSDDAEFTVVAEQGLPTASPARRRYTGALSAQADVRRPGTLRLVHTVALETYVAGVVQREYGMNDLEGSKAMAVLARTYALRQRGRVPDYDLVDTIEHQVYFGVEGVGENARQASEQTHGELLTFQGRLAEAVYSASSGGYTASNDAVWNSQSVSYLRAQPDPYDARLSPHKAWTSRLDATAFLNALSRSYGPDVTGFRVTGRGDDGRAQQVALTLASGQTRTVTATQFRRIANSLGGAMTLRSYRFDAALSGGKAVFTGSGFGHGVGLSQWGARAQALEGRSYRQILGFYFPGTALRNPDGLAEPTPSAPTLDVILAGAREVDDPATALATANATAISAITLSGRPSRNASTRVALPPPTAPVVARPPAARPSTPLPDGAYRPDPLGVRSAPPAVRASRSAPPEPVPEPLPDEDADRADRAVVTWGTPVAASTPTGSAGASRRVGW